ncbi:MAG: TRAP transporter small permease [Pseudomonadota bacterium]
MSTEPRAAYDGGDPRIEPGSTAGERFVDRALDLMRRAAAIVGGVALLVIVFAMGWQVFGRYVLNATPTWAEQLSLVLIVVITFLLAGVGVAENTHLSVTAIRDRLPKPLANALVVVRDLLMIGFGAAMAVQGYRLVQFGWSTNVPLLDIPDGVRSIPIVLCGGMMVLCAAVFVWRRLRGRPLPKLDPPETPGADAG